MHNKKGFTLVELLAVVAILGILSIVAIGAYSGITNRSKQKAYESKVSQIETSAAKWARENNIDRTTTISVNKLVVEGYLTADEVTENGLSSIKNPVNNENMICKMVEITYKNGEIQTKFIDNKNNCTLAEQALNDTKIKVIAYQKGVTGASAALSPNSNNALAWTNKALTLVVSSDNYKDEAQNSRETNPIVSVSFDFNGNTTEKNVVIDSTNPSKKKSNVYTGNTYIDNIDAYYNVFNVDATIILDSNVVVSYRFKDGSTKSRTINVRIDKEEATASVIATSDWVTATQKVIVKLDDGNGSGARRFYVGVGNSYNAPGVNKVELCDANGKNCKYEKEYNAPSVGEYNIWTEDMVGNISVQPKNKISVNNVDTSTPSCNFDNIGTMGQGNWYITDVIPRMRTSVAGNSGLYFGISKIQNGKDNPNYSNYVGYGSVGISQAAKLSDTKGQDYICYVKSLAGTKTQKKTNIKVDTIPPTITISPTNQSSSYVKEKTITIKARDTISGLGKNSRVEYAWSTDSNNEPSTWQTVALPGTDYTGENGPTDEKSVTITAKGMTGVYYLWIKKGTISDAAGNASEGSQGKSVRYGPFKFDNTPPSCELQASGKIGDNNWYTTDVNIRFKTHSDNDSGVKNYGLSSITGSKTASLTSDTSSKTYTGYIEDNAGNKSSCSITVKRDATKPTCSLEAKGTKGTNNWFTSDITVKFKTSTDAMSGLVRKGINSINNADTLRVTTDNTGTKYIGYVKDNAGNIGTCEATYKLDKTAPACALKVTGNLGDNGWYKSNTTITVDTHTDATSGVDGYGLSTNGSINYTNTYLTQTLDTKGVIYTGYIKDKAGNTATCGPVTIKKDSKAPSCELQASGTKGENNWYTSDVKVTFKSPSDATSGIAQKGIGGFDKSDTLTINYDTTGTTYYGFIKDNAGNSAICNATYKVDRTKPTCSLKTSGTAGENGWYRGNVTVEFASYNDWASGISGHGLSTNGTANYTNTKLTQTSDTTGTTYTGYVKDNAGHKNSCSVTVKRDTQAPSCELQASGTKGKNGWYKSGITVSFKSATDTTSGIALKGLGGYYGSATETQNDNTAGKNYTGYVKDYAGNTATCTATYKIDKTAPTCSITASGTYGWNSWYITDVAISLKSSGTDWPSGVKSYGIGSTGGATSATLNYDTSSKKYTGYIEDEAGNTSSCSIEVKRDATKPSCTLSKSCSTWGNNGWCKSNVDIKFSSTYDAMSGVDGYGIGYYYNKPVSETLSTDTGASGKTYTGYIIDKAGNKAQCYTTAYRDTIPPAASLCSSAVSKSGTLGYDGWYTSNVTVSTTNSDISYFRLDGQAKTTITTDGYHSVTLYDAAGNSRACDSIKIDKTNPTIDIWSNVPECPSNSRVNYRMGHVTDATSGLSSARTYYYVGTTTSDVIKYGPATPNGANEGVEGYCSGANTLYTSYHVCDVAGNCIDGHWSWTTKP